MKMSTLWADIEPYIQVLVQNSGFDSVDSTRGLGAPDVTSEASRGKHARKSVAGDSVQEQLTQQYQDQLDSSARGYDIVREEPAPDDEDTQYAPSEHIEKQHAETPPSKTQYQEAQQHSHAESFDKSLAEAETAASSAMFQGTDNLQGTDSVQDTVSGVTADGTLPERQIPSSASPMTSLRRNHTRKEKVDELKLRYIAGKVAGRDILDRKGNVLVKRGDILTADNIQLAEEAGKLVELIVHMVIDDLGD